MFGHFWSFLVIARNLKRLTRQSTIFLWKSVILGKIPLPNHYLWYEPAVGRVVSSKRRFYTTLHYTTLRYSTLHYTTLPSTTLHYITLHSTTLQLHLRLHNYTPLHSTTLNYTKLHYFTLHSTTLHYTKLQ